jgi:hypothetical protein
MRRSVSLEQRTPKDPYALFPPTSTHVHPMPPCPPPHSEPTPRGEPQLPLPKPRPLVFLPRVGHHLARPLRPLLLRPHHRAHFVQRTHMERPPASCARGTSLLWCTRGDDEAVSFLRTAAKKRLPTPSLPVALLCRERQRRECNKRLRMIASSRFLAHTHAHCPTHTAALLVDTGSFAGRPLHYPMNRSRSRPVSFWRTFGESSALSAIGRCRSVHLFARVSCDHFSGYSRECLVSRRWLS